MDEQALIAAARRGDLRAFNELVLAYQDRVYNLAYRILGDPDAAADATQEAFLSAYQGLDRYRGGSFRSWLMRIVTNACYDELRRRKRRPVTSLEALTEAGSSPPPPTNTQPESPEAYAERQELHRLLEAAIQTLPPDQRITLVLSDVEGLSYQEIAEITGVALGTVKSRLSRARARLRDYLLAHKELLPTPYRLKT